jgi:hypothetical protein
MVLSKHTIKTSLTVIGAVFMLMAAVMPASAATNPKASDKKTSTDITNAVAQSYNADPSVKNSMLVQLKDKDPSTVVPLKSENAGDMLGIVVPSDQANIIITPEKSSKQQVLVATTGHYDVLVTSQQGSIKPGDYLAVSAIAGLAMRAGETEAQVIGQATGTFDGKTNVIGSVELKDSTGKTRKVSLGRVKIDISVTHNPNYRKTADYVPELLGKVAAGIANKPVSAARIYLSITVLFIVSILAGNVLYSGIRSGMIAVGRNPLSKKSIMRSLIETLIAGLIIFVAGVFAVYLLLKL